MKIVEYQSSVQAQGEFKYEFKKMGDPRCGFPAL